MQKVTSQTFKQLRVYRRLSTPLLLNDMLCNRFMKMNFLVDKAPTIYTWSTKIFGHGLINWVVHSTYCKVFTAGSNVFEVDQTADYYRKAGVPVILDYCAEGDISKGDLDKNLDQNADLFAESSRMAAQHQNEMMSIKLTGLLDVRVLKKLNDVVQFRDAWWDKNNRNGELDYEGLKKGLLELIPDLTEADIKNYLEKVYGFTGQPSSFRANELVFKANHHPFYLFWPQKNSLKVITKFYAFSDLERQKLKDLIKRLNLICDHAADNKNNFRILVDAEQSYVQKAIESISQQLQERYNKNQAYIIPTIQNYLKRSIARGNFEIELAKYKKLKFGAKLVRGAYIVEESKLAKEKKYENPIVDDFDKTTINYLTNFRNMAQQVKEGEVVVATHNQSTIEEVILIASQIKDPLKVSFAQLLGLADHLTWYLKSQGYPVYKYLPWAETEVMVPYMIRRAQELNQMKYPLDIQYQLLKHELGLRIKGQ